MKRLARWSVAALVTTAAAVAMAGAGATEVVAAPRAEEGSPEAGGTFAVRAGRVYPVAEGAPWAIEDGVVLVRDGRVAAVGAWGEVEVSRDVPVIELPDATIVPGFVAASSDVAGRHAGDESVGAGYRAVDAFDRYEEYRDLLAGGVTTVHLNPGWHRLVSGRGAVVRLAGDPGARVLKGEADLTVNLGPGATNPPNVVDYLEIPTGDTPIEPAQPQRPTSRVSQYLALKEAIEASTTGSGSGTEYDVHRSALGRAWRNGTPVRVQAQRAEDLSGAINFLSTSGREGYVVGGFEAHEIADELRASELPLVYTIDSSFRAPGGNLGNDEAALDPSVRDLAALEGVTLALAMRPGDSPEDLRLAAATARRAGLSEEAVLRAITRTPAEILGVADEVGSLAPGRRADFLVMTGEPLETTSHVSRVYAGGELVYHARDVTRRVASVEPAAPEALVVKAGTIWLGPDEWLEDGAVLIENGRIVDVGKRVSVPRHARVIDAGAEAFVTPGMIDAYGHLGLEGDRTTPGTQISLARLVGPSDVASERVARAGVTTVVLGPYSVSNAGSQVAAIKTAGADRDARVVRETAAVVFDFSNVDPKAIPNQLKGRLEAGKKYLKTWQDYEKALAEWEKKKAEGTLEETKPKTEEVVVEEAKVDPVTGTWSVQVSGGPLPQEVQGKIALRLTGQSIEGRVVEPDPGIEHRILGTLNGTSISGTIEVDTGGMGTPTWSATLPSPDLMNGTVGLEGIGEANFTAQRVDKEDVEFKVTRTRRKKTGEDGRPLPPPVDESLEPLKALLEKKIPAAVAVSTPVQIREAVKVLAEEYEVPVVLLGAEGAAEVAETLRKHEVGVVLPTAVMTRGERIDEVTAERLRRRGIPVAFRSDAEDAARTLPSVGLFAVSRGLDADAALAALTIEPARLYRLDDRVGSLAPGKDGDLVIFTGFPFDANARVERVIINGKEVKP